MYDSLMLCVHLYENEIKGKRERSEKKGVDVSSTFAMTGALSWQVKKDNKIHVSCFGGEKVRGLPGSSSPVCCVLFAFPPFTDLD